MARIASGFGQAVRSLRVQAGLSRRQVSRKGGISVARLRHLEEGRGHWWPDDLRRTADGLGVPVQTLVNLMRDQYRHYHRAAREARHAHRIAVEQAVATFAGVAQER